MGCLPGSETERLHLHKEIIRQHRFKYKFAIIIVFKGLYSPKQYSSITQGTGHPRTAPDWHLFGMMGRAYCRDANLIAAAGFSFLVQIEPLTSAQRHRKIAHMPKELPIRQGLSTAVRTSASCTNLRVPA